MQAASVLQAVARRPGAGMWILSGEVPETPERTYSFCSDVLHLAEELSEENAIVLHAGQQTLTELVPRLRAFDDARIQLRETAGLTVLVVDERGDATWMGVNRRQSRLLSVLQARGPMAITDLSDQLGLALPALRDELRPLRHWIVESSEGVRLAPAPADLLEGLALWLADEIGSREDGCVTQRAREGTVLVTPSLSYVSRWINVRELVAAVADESLVGLVLAHRVATQLNQRAFENVTVVKVGDVPEGVARALASGLGCQSRIPSLSGEVGIHDDPEVPFLHPTSRLIIITDVLGSSTRVRHAVDDLVRSGATPLAVVSIVDGRRTADQLPVLGGQVEVVSLGTLDLYASPEGKERIPIDPVSVARQGEATPLDYRIGHRQLLDWCHETDDVLLTGHIARFARRHFHSFLDALPLLAGAHAEEIASAANQSIAEYLGSLPRRDEDPVTRLAILHPGRPSDPAGRFAHLVAEEWNAGRAHVPAAAPTSLERVLWGGRWVFPSPEQGFAKGTHALVVDWGAVTLYTLNELMGIAGQLGAASVHAVVFAGQLSEHDERLARRVRAIAAKPSTLPADLLFSLAADNGEEVSIPARIEFLSSFRVGFSNASECAPCRHALEYAQLSRDAPTELLATHALDLAAILAPRDLGEARQGGAQDAFGDELRSSETVAIMRFREDIEAAERSTQRRIDLLDRLESLGPEDTCHIIRLLLLEPRLLKAAPLRFKICRAAIAAAVRRNVIAETFNELSVSMRRQHIMALRATSKEAFLERFPTLLLAELRRAGGEVVAYDLLLSAYTLLSRAYHRNRDDRRTIRQAIGTAIDLLQHEVELLREDSALSAMETLSALLAVNDYGLADHQPETLQDVWRELRLRFLQPVVDHRADVRMGSVATAVRLRRLRDEDRWVSTLRDWQMSKTFLVDNVLAYLPRLEDVGLAHLYEVGAVNDVERWRRACSPDVVADLGQVEAILRRFARRPSEALEKTEEAHRLIGWWRRFFFDLEGPGVLALINDCPCALGAPIHGAVAHGREIADSQSRPVDISVLGSTDVQTFGPSTVVEAALRQMVDNALKKEHAVGGELGEVVIEIEVGETDADVVVTVRNTGTQVVEPPGRGLWHYNRHLRHYGASLESRETTAAWTFVVSLRLEKWGAISSKLDESGHQ